MRGLTTKQRQVLLVVAQGINTAGQPPTVRELAAALGISSSCSVQRHLDALEKKGHLLRSRYRFRSLRLTETGWAAVLPELPGCCRCGGPLVAPVTDRLERSWCRTCASADLARVNLARAREATHA